VGITIIRGVFILFCALFGYVATILLLKSKPLELLSLEGLVAGMVLGSLFIVIERSIRKSPIGTVVGGALGLFAGLGIASLFSYTVSASYLGGSPAGPLLYLFVTCLLAYLGLAVGAKKGEEVSVGERPLFSTNQGPREHSKILDTSVIIDGRIADIIETGFVEGTMIIPQFVLQELMYIADSSDSLKRTRGRRGLDILNRIQKQTEIDVRIVDHDFPKIREVDAKLVALAKRTGGKLVTNDFNLNKLAEFQGVTVLNVNQLATSLKPAVLPGELMNVFIQREGKEQGQGVAYLDDGTMVVVENGKRHIGRNVDVSVTSVLQTTAGRMIFTVPKTENTPEYASSSGRS
jgi:uncharacterized protein YacL